LCHSFVPLLLPVDVGAQSIFGIQHVTPNPKKNISSSISSIELLTLKPPNRPTPTTNSLKSFAVAF
jgi:hypothetical protein